MNRLYLLLLLLPVCVFAQERVTVKGRIVNAQGDPVEYVQVGIPSQGIGTISSLDGRFSVEVPAETLEFHHVSYQTGYYLVSGPAEDVLIVLEESELAPAVFIAGDTKEKYLLRAGVRIPQAVGDFHLPGGTVKGNELGSVARARKPFLIKDIRFSLLSNHIPGCVASINIYRIEENPESFINILHKPIYVDVPVSDEKQDFDIQPEEPVLLEPGKYFISFALVDCDMDAVRKLEEIPESERDPLAMHLIVPMYFKSSYERFQALGKLIHFPVNIGLEVKGMEYQ